jgi:hypothetical protein
MPTRYCRRATDPHPRFSWLSALWLWCIRRQQPEEHYPNSGFLHTDMVEIILLPPPDEFGASFADDPHSERRC